jgi:hypothetical protein
LESELYKWISELYIPPLEYEGIKDVLKERRIVIITGEQEYGKTYTALRILWEFYNKDPRYQLKYIQNKPKYIQNRQEEDIIQALQRIDKKLDNSIIYFEDPFGKTFYENNKQFQDNVGRIIDNLKNNFKIMLVV